MAVRMRKLRVRTDGDVQEQRQHCHPERVNGVGAGEGEMNRVGCASGSEVEAEVAVVRGSSPFLSMVPEDRSRVGEVARCGRVHHPV